MTNRIGVNFCGVTMDAPTVGLSGCVGFGEEYTRIEGFSNADLGAICLKGTTPEEPWQEPSSNDYQPEIRSKIKERKILNLLFKSKQAHKIETLKNKQKKEVNIPTKKKTNFWLVKLKRFDDTNTFRKRNKRYFK